MDLKGDSKESGASPFRPQAETTEISSASHTKSWLRLPDRAAVVEIPKSRR